MGFEASHEDVITTGVEERVKSGREIGWRIGVRGNVDVMDVYGDLDDSCATVVVIFSVQLICSNRWREKIECRVELMFASD